MDNIIGVCGITCSKCPAYLATQANDRAALERVAAEWSKMFHASIAPEDCICDGCLSTTERLSGYCHECRIRACGIERGVVSCAYCDDYGCEKMVSFVANVPEAKMTLEVLRQASTK